MSYGIPTTYAGVRFRSRLEAKWAAFFDLLGWTWQYEPFDLKGWIPDFLLPGKCPVLVEIKPISLIDLEICHEIGGAAKSFDGNLMLCGCVAPVRAPDLKFGTSIGWLFEPPNSANSLSWGRGWSAAILGDYRRVGGDVGLCHAAGCYADRITGAHDGDGCFIDIEARVQAAWARAGNLTQWKAA